MTSHHRIITSAAIVLALAASAAPAAARPFDLNANGSYVPANTQPVSNPGGVAYTNGNSSSSAPATIVRVSSGGGFDWGDAGIGAAGGIAISMLGLGTALAVSGRRARRPATHRA